LDQTRSETIIKIDIREEYMCRDLTKEKNICAAIWQNRA